MRALVTGGNGYLGSRLVKALLEKGYRISVLERTFTDTSRIIDVLPHISFYSLDETDLDRPFTLDGRIDLVFHTATSYGRSGESPFQIFRTNTALPHKIMKVAAQHDVDTFVNMDTSVQRSLNAYALSKDQFRDWGEFYAGKGSIRFLNLELEQFYGPGDSDTKFTTHVFRSLIKNVPELDLTLGEQKRDFIYIDDAISAIILIVENRQALAPYFNCSIGSGEAVSIRDLVELAKEITGSGTKLNFGAVPYRENEVMFSQADTGFLKELGWIPIFNLEEGIRNTVSTENSLDRSI